MNYNYPKNAIDEFIRTLDDELVCITFKSVGTPICCLHQLKKGVFARTKIRGGLFFVIDPTKNSFFFKLYDADHMKVRWSCKIPEKNHIKLSGDELMIVCDIHALFFENPKFNKARYLKRVYDIFDEEFDPKEITFYRKDKSAETTKPKRKSRKTRKTRKKKKNDKNIREPFTPSPESNKVKKKKKKKEGKEECVALFDYKAKSPLELSVKEGDVLKIHGINQDEGYIVGEIINPSDMAVSSKSKRRTGKSVKTKKKTSTLGQIPEHYTNHLLDEYKEKLKEKDELENAIKKFEKYKALEEKRLKKREADIEFRESHVEQDRLEANREVEALRNKLIEDRRVWEIERKKELDAKRKELESSYRGRREEIIKNEKSKRKELTLRENKLRRLEERNSGHGKRLVDKEQQIQELSKRVTRRTKRIKARERHINEREQIIDVQEKRFKERNYNLKKLEVKLVKKDKMLQRKERELKRQEGILNKKRFALQLPSEGELEKELENEKQKRMERSKISELEEEEKKIGDTVFHDLLKKQQEVDQLTTEIEMLKREVSGKEKLKKRISEYEKLNTELDLEIQNLRNKHQEELKARDEELRKIEETKTMDADEEVKNIISSQKTKIETLQEKVRLQDDEKREAEQSFRTTLKSVNEEHELELKKKLDEADLQIKNLKEKHGVEVSKMSKEYGVRVKSLAEKLVMLKSKVQGEEEKQKEVQKLRDQIKSLLKVKEGGASSEIKKLKTTVKKLKAQNKKQSKKISVLEQIKEEQKMKIRSQSQRGGMNIVPVISSPPRPQFEEEEKTYRGKYSSDEIRRMELELRFLLEDVRSKTRNEQLWYQMNFVNHSKLTRNRLNELADQLKKRSLVLEKREDKLDDKSDSLYEKETELDERESELKKKEVNSLIEDSKGKEGVSGLPDPDLTLRASQLEDLRHKLGRDEKKLQKKEEMMKDWEKELKKREEELDRLESELHKQRMDFLQEKKELQNQLHKMQLHQEQMLREDMEDNETHKSPPTSPRRISEVKHMTQESPGRLQMSKGSFDSPLKSRPRRMSRESPGRLESSPKGSPNGKGGGGGSDSDDPEVPEHLKPSFGKRKSRGKFNFILGRYEHRIKHENKVKQKLQDFEEKKQERLTKIKTEDMLSLKQLLNSEKVKSLGGRKRGVGGGSCDSPTSLPSPLSARGMSLKKFVDTKPPIPSKTRRLKTDELADIIYSPTMRNDQLKIFQDFEDNDNGDKKKDNEEQM